MSVIKSRRSIASTQFLFNLQKLEQEVLAWCKTQGNKNNDYGLSTIFKITNRAFITAYQGNEIKLKDEKDLELRKQAFNTSIRWLHTFNAELTVLMSCYNISNAKIKRWMGYVYKAITQMENVIQFNEKYIQKLKNKNN